MDRGAFVRRRGRVWRRLEELLTRANRRGLRSLGPPEIFELARLYRRVSSDLAYAQGRRYDADLLHYLNRLTARTHGYVYGEIAEGGGTRLSTIFSHTFPREVRASWAYCGACSGLTILWAAVAYAIVLHDPSDAYALMPAWLVPEHITRSLHDSNFAFGPESSATMSALIITNNVRIAILAFAAGIVTLGLGTVYLIFYNGLMVGALGALYARAGFGGDFWATVAPHGAIELTAIQIAGGAGLLLAAGVLLPGRWRRRDAIARNARRAGVLIGGVAAMLCVAGLIEGFFSPLRFSPAAREGVGVVSAVLLTLYFALAGRHSVELAR